MMVVLINFTLVYSLRTHIGDLRIRRSPCRLGSQEDLVQTFSPELTPETATAMISITGVLVVAAGIWWNQVIPQKRTELALSKKKGSVRDFLDELKEADENDSMVRFNRWLFTDWLRKDTKTKDAALPFLKKAKWNSGDNPILVAFAGIMALVFTSSIAERAAQH